MLVKYIYYVSPTQMKIIENSTNDDEILQVIVDTHMLSLIHISCQCVYI